MIRRTGSTLPTHDREGILQAFSDRLAAGVGPRSRSESMLPGLNDGQRRAVLAVSGPVVIRAGADTGKTRTISRRVGYAIASGAVSAKNLLVVSFTTKAVG